MKRLIQTGVCLVLSVLLLVGWFFIGRDSVGTGPTIPLLATVATQAVTTTTGSGESTHSASSLNTDGTSSTDKTTVSVGQVSSVTTIVTTTKPTTSTTTTVATTTKPPAAQPDEVRGVWVSYIELNALFSKCGTQAQAKAALDGLFDNIKRYGMNTVFFHVRANSDAYYSSAIFKPASSVESLLSTGFDPLAYAVEAAHKRQLELHAWVNPYRIGTKADYIVPDIPTFQDASKKYYYVPTSTVSQDLILRGIRELLNQYDIDGVQYDDYFYPTGLLEETAVYAFESADYEAYQQGGGRLSVGNWRRAGVYALVAGTYTLTKAKGKVFGVSPNHDAAKTYSQMYADTKKWLSQSGYVDYLCPQLYFGFEHSTAAFDTMTDTWMSYPRHASVDLYIGLAAYKIGLKDDRYAGAGRYEWKNHNDILKRSVLHLRRKQLPGFFFYSATFFEPTTCTVSDFQTANNLSVAKKEIQNLLSIL